VNNGSNLNDVKVATMEIVHPINARGQKRLKVTRYFTIKNNFQQFFTMNSVNDKKLSNRHLMLAVISNCSICEQYLICHVSTMEIAHP